MQALELTNGEFLSEVLKNGADKWQEVYADDKNKMLDEIFQELLGRLPTKQEKRSISKTLSKNPSSEEIQDLFWALILLPEFQFIS